MGPSFQNSHLLWKPEGEEAEENSKENFKKNFNLEL